MPYCKNCGSEVNDNFCPNCGTPLNNTFAQPQYIVHENAQVTARYDTVSLFLAGYFGWSGVISFFTSLTAPGLFILFALVPLLLTIACFLPGILSIMKKTPEELVPKTICSFIIRSFLFCVAWAIVLVSCVWIIGLFLRSWRLGLSFSKCKDNEYTALVDGQKISVFRIIDTDYSSPDKTRYIYVDGYGEYYRPTLR